MVNVDMWYGDSVRDADKISISFNDLSGKYAGNIFKEGKFIGDYTCDSSVELTKYFDWLNFKWD